MKLEWEYIYEILEDDNGMYRVIDERGEDYLYLKENPTLVDGSRGGCWEIIGK